MPNPTFEAAALTAEEELTQLRQELALVEPKKKRMAILERTLADLRGLLDASLTLSQGQISDSGSNGARPRTSARTNGEHPSLSSERPTYREGILAVLREAGGGPLGLRPLVAEMERRHWIAPGNNNPVETIRTTASVLVQSGALVRVEASTWALPVRPLRSGRKPRGRKRARRLKSAEPKAEPKLESAA